MELGSQAHRDGGGAAVTMELCTPHTPSQLWTVRAPAGASGGGREIVSGTAAAPVCLEWGGSPDSGTMVAQAYRLVERIAPLYLGISGEQILVGCFGWLLDLVIEWTGEPSQAYPFLNADAPQWSGSNATYADVRDFISALKV